MTTEIKGIRERDLREIAQQRFDYLPDDSPIPEAWLVELRVLSANELFEHWCDWHGLIGWAGRIRQVLHDCQLAEIAVRDDAELERMSQPDKPTVAERTVTS